MSDYKNILLGTVISIGLSISSLTYADDVNEVLKESHIGKATSFESIPARHVNNPAYIQDYITNQRINDSIKNTVTSRTVAVTGSQMPRGWYENLGNPAKL